MQYCRWLIIIFCCILLQACVSPRMSQEFQLGKLSFQDGDYKKAFVQLLPVAVYGKPAAQYAIGYMYYYGYGTCRNLESGIFWMTRAANCGYIPAIRALEIIRCRKPDCGEIVEKTEVRHEVHLPTPRTLKGEISVKKHDEILRAVMQKPASEALEKAAITPPQKIAEAQNPVADLKPVVAPQIQVSEESNYTLQLFGAFKLDDVKKLQQTLDLKNKSHIWHAEHQGKDWYVLTYGKFASAGEARLIREKLAEDVKDLEPWIRRFNGLNEIKVS